MACGAMAMSASAPAEAQRTSARWTSVSTGTPVSSDSGGRAQRGMRSFGSMRCTPVPDV